MDRDYVSNSSSSPTGSESSSRSLFENNSRRNVVSTNFQNPKQEEWTTSRKVTNHTTRQVETRVKRQIILEDGKVISDSGPQVTTKTTEDTKIEDNEIKECKTGDIVTEKTDTRLITHQVKEENLELEDEPWLQLTADAYHNMSISNSDVLHGKLTNYSSKSRKVIDRDVERAVTELINGELSTETTTTHHHEEIEDDEVPEDESNRLTIPEVSINSNRTFEWSNNDNPPDLIETAKTKAGGNIINIQMTSNRKPSPKTSSQVIHIREEEGCNKAYDKKIQVNLLQETHTKDSQTQTPTKIKKDFNLPRIKTTLNGYKNVTKHNGYKNSSELNRKYNIPQHTPSRPIHPHHTNVYNSSSSATPPDSPLAIGYRDCVTDYRKWPTENRKWIASDGTVIVEVKQPYKKYF
ncbi:mucin-16-like [Centruroides vittatus]|uniref:mucin-16-like n=1 Tax=Centruroides vittatus TaxID=120091 RepID=UPI003510BC51